MINSVFRTEKNYYPEVYLEECKYVVKEKRYLTMLVMIQTFFFFDGSDREDSDYSDEEYSNE